MKPFRDVKKLIEQIEQFKNFCIITESNEEGEEVEKTIHPPTLERLQCFLSCSMAQLNKYTSEGFAEEIEENLQGREAHLSNLKEELKTAESERDKYIIEESIAEDKRIILDYKVDLKIIPILLDVKRWIKASHAEFTFDSRTNKGAEFLLKNNFNYTDRNEINANIDNRVVIVDDIPEEGTEDD